MHEGLAYGWASIVYCTILLCRIGNEKICAEGARYGVNIVYATVNMHAVDSTLYTVTDSGR